MAFDMFGSEAYPGAPSGGTIYDYGQRGGNPFGDPKTAALLGLAQGLLAAGAPHSTPVGLGGALGQGIGGALTGAMNATQMNQRQALVDLEQQKLKQAQAQFAMQQGLLRSILPGGGGTSQGPSTAASGGTDTPAGMSPTTSTALFGSPEFATPSSPAAPQSSSSFPFSLSQVAAMRLAGMPDLTAAFNASQPNVRIGNGLMYDTRSGNVIRAVPQTNQQGFSTITVPDASAPNGFRVDVVPGAMPAYLAQQRAGEQARAERDLVTIPATAPNKPPTYASRESIIQGSAGGAPAAGMSPAAASAQAASAAQQSEVAKNYGKIYNDLQNSSVANPAKIAKFQRIGSLLDGFEGGKFSQAGLDIAKAANSAGLRIDENLPNKEAAVALANEVALELRSTGSGQGMPGSMSDQDREFLKSMTPQLAQTNEGRKTIIDARVKVMQRENRVADMARQYKKKYGNLDEDFFSQLQSWADRNPIFQK